MVSSSGANAPVKLKPILRSFRGDSSRLRSTTSGYSGDPRDIYMQSPKDSPPPVISISDFVPRKMVEHLMRNKKDAALAVKYQNGDKITNMEGAMHTFVTPITLCQIHGDYHWKNGHQIRKLGKVNGKNLVRTVVISASIQPDFEFETVMMELCSLTAKPVVGTALGIDFTIPSANMKSEFPARESYDARLKSHMIFHLTEAHNLPSYDAVKQSALNIADTIDILERNIMGLSATDFSQLYVRQKPREYLSIEILVNTAIESLRNEISALEAVCPQGYIYTSDPPSIFAARTEAVLLNRIAFVALKLLSSHDTFSNMKVFAFNNYADPQATFYLRKALRSQPHIEAISKKELFNDGQMTGHYGYRPLPGTEGALLVLHNNSDAFGQNIETEGAFGSMDGAIGANSSCSASLCRSREDLLSQLI